MDFLQTAPPAPLLPTSLATPASVGTWIELSKSAFDSNVAWYKKIIGPSVALAVVVKSNAYGHGLEQIAQLCQRNENVDWLCMTSLTEALILRSQGITKPLLVLALIDGDSASALEHSIDLVVYDLALVHHLNAQAQALGKKAYIHLKIDTGLTRFGFLPDEVEDILVSIDALPGIEVRGLCSHFAESDSHDETFTHLQLERFHKVLDTLRMRRRKIDYIHTSNTAATTSFPQSRFTMVRVGAGIYGLRPSLACHAKIQEGYPDFELRSVMTWKTVIVFCRKVPAQSSVGYGKTYVTRSPSTIGFLPIGYYEGYDRRFSNKGRVVVLSKEGNIKGHAPVIGRVCMNITMIDLTLVSAAEVGDEVVLLGNYNEVRAHDLATTIESFNPREITTRINGRIARYVTE